MFAHLSPTQFSDRDRRWLVHIIAALHNLVEDEIELEEHAYHDPHIWQDPDRHNRLTTYVHALIDAGMVHTHVEETATMQAEHDAWWAVEQTKMAALGFTVPDATEEDGDA